MPSKGKIEADNDLETEANQTKYKEESTTVSEIGSQVEIESAIVTQKKEESKDMFEKENEGKSEYAIENDLESEDVIETKNEVESEDGMENGNKVEMVTAIDSEKEVERSIVKNSVAVSDTADYQNTVVDREDSPPMVNNQVMSTTFTEMV